MRGRSHRRPGMASTNKPWYERRSVAARLAEDRNWVGREYPGLSFLIDEERESITLDGTITIKEECGVPTQIATKVLFPRSYPDNEPIAYDSGDRFPHVAVRHFYKDGGCCLWLPPETLWRADDPLALHGFLDELSVFFHQQLVFEATGCVIWPGQERGHNVDGYIEFVDEQLGADASLIPVLAPLFAGRHVGRNEPCPCFRGRKYKLCHQDMVEVITRRIGVLRTRELFQGWIAKDQPSEKIGNTPNLNCDV